MTKCSKNMRWAASHLLRATYRQFRRIREDRTSQRRICTKLSWRFPEKRKIRDPRDEGDENFLPQCVHLRPNQGNSTWQRSDILCHRFVRTFSSFWKRKVLEETQKNRFPFLPLDVKRMQSGVILRRIRHQRFWLPFGDEVLFFLKWRKSETLRNCEKRATYLFGQLGHVRWSIAFPKTQPNDPYQQKAFQYQMVPRGLKKKDRIRLKSMNHRNWNSKWYLPKWMKNIRWSITKRRPAFSKIPE